MPQKKNLCYGEKMWLIISILAAMLVTILWKFLPENNLRLETLAIMFWGLGLMIMIDHILGYEGGAFLEAETDGLVASGYVLGIFMLIPVLAIWVVYVILANRKENPVRSE